MLRKSGVCWCFGNSIEWIFGIVVETVELELKSYKCISVDQVFTIQNGLEDLTELRKS